MKLRAVLLIFGLLAFFSVSVGGILYYSLLRASIQYDVVAKSTYHAEIVVNLISSHLSDYQKTVRALAGLRELQKAFENTIENSIAKANLVLDHFKDSFEASVAYLMDQNGQTIASSNRNESDSFVGKNYSFRPYFQNAIAGDTSTYMALGITSKKRGIYYSHPVYNGTKNAPIGVAVLKFGVDRIEKEFIRLQKFNAEMFTFLIGPHDIVFMSDHKNFIYRFLWPVSEKTLADILESNQFGKGPWESTGFKRIGEDKVVDETGNEYLVIQKEIPSFPGWNVVHFHSTSVFSKVINTPLLGTTGYIILALYVFIGSSIFFLYNLGKSDINQRLKAEKALREREGLIQAVLDNLPIGVAVSSVDPTAQIQYMNDNFPIHYRTTRKALADPNAFWDVVYEDPELREEIKKRVQDDCASGVPERMYWADIPITRKGSETSYITARDIPIPDKQLMISTVWDVTARIQAAEEIRRSKILLESSIESPKDMIILSLDCDYRYLYLNKTHAESMKHVYGTRPRIGDCIFDHMKVQDDIQKVKAHYDRAFAGEGHIAIEEYGEGQARYYYEIRYNPIYDEKNETIGVTAFAQDITERKQAEEELDRIFELSPDLICMANISTGYFSRVNPAWEIFGYPLEELTSRPFNDFIHPDDRESTAQQVENQMSGKSVFKFENRYRCIDGSYRDLEWHATMAQADGTVCAVARDITERRQMETRLQQAQKMESIGNLAGGIAHDFNNILYPIVGMSELLLDDLPSASLEHENAQEILKAGKRGRDLVKQILAFSRQAEHKMIPVRVQQILREVIELSRSTIPSNINITHIIKNDCGLVKADPTQVHQIAMNLITNAYHAVVPTGGEITITLRETVIGADDLADISLEPGQYVLLAVSDTGVGIESAAMEKIFDPYFTTKEKGKGTGLGLAVVYGIVKEHKGDIKVHSELGAGTVFNVYLPLMEKTTEVLPDGGFESYETGTERILLVDDEEPIVHLEKQLLERLGYYVTARTSSPDALEAFRRAPDSFDLVISDMTMPNMTGDQLSKELIAIKPGIPIIICTGFSEGISRDKASTIGIKGFLMKPVVKSEMARTVRRVLDMT